MLRRFNLGLVGFCLFAAVMALGLATPRAASAMTLGPATLDRPISGQAVTPAHCKKHRHYHKRCRYCRRVYHTCPKK